MGAHILIGPGLAHSFLFLHFSSQDKPGGFSFECSLSLSILRSDHQIISLFLPSVNVHVHQLIVNQKYLMIVLDSALTHFYTWCKQTRFWILISEDLVITSCITRLINHSWSEKSEKFFFVIRIAKKFSTFCLKTISPLCSPFTDNFS